MEENISSNINGLITEAKRLDIPEEKIKDCNKQVACLKVAYSDTNQLLIKLYSNLTIEKSIKASAKF